MFDTGPAETLGFLLCFLHYSLMGLVSIIAAGVLNAVWSILVVAMMLGPAAAAYLLTEKLLSILGLSVGIGILSAVSNDWMANLLDAFLTGSMAVMIGVIFLLVFLFTPTRVFFAS